MNHLLGSETKPVPEQPSVHSTDSLLSAIPTMSEQQHPHGASQCQSLSAAAGEQQPPTAVPASGSASPPAQSPSRTRKASNADLVLSDVRPSKRQRGEGKHQDTVPPGVMGLNQSVPPRSDRTSGTLNSEATSRNRTRDPNVSNSNSNVNEIYGSGTVNNNNNNNNVYVDARPPAHPPPYKSDLNVSASLPAKPIVFHGRDGLVHEVVQLLTAPGTVRIAILGPGGMGKTTVALAVLYHEHVVGHFHNDRLFLSCEAFVNADAIVVSLAKLFELAPSGDLLAGVISRFTAIPRVLLVLDNLETAWLAGGTPVIAVDELLGRLAQIPSLSLIITCRGTDLPQSVKWSNTNTAVLEPFSLQAAVETFQNKAGRQLTNEDSITAKELLNAVDRMPLAVSLLGQLARRGNSVSELLIRWERERTSLLRTHGAGRINNAGVSIELSIGELCASDDTQEALQLLSLCSMQPEGLHRNVFEKLRPQFKCIDRARDSLSLYSLTTLNSEGVLKTLSPVRHHVLERHPPQPEHLRALHSIYFDIAQQLPIEINENFRELAAIAAPELGNLSFLLLTLADEPSQHIVDSIVQLTRFISLQQPSLTVASALLLHLEPHPEWKAACLKAIGNGQIVLGEYKAATDSLATAADIFCEVGNRSEAAWCKCAAGEPLRQLGEYDRAETLLNEAREVYIELGDDLGEAMCRKDLGRVMRMKANYPAAIEHLSAAQQTFTALGSVFWAARCSESLGIIYLDQGDLASAATELKSARSALDKLGARIYAAQSTGFLSIVLHQQGELILAEKLLGEVEIICRDSCNRLGLAHCAKQFGCLRADQGRQDEAIAHFKFARHLYEKLQMKVEADHCRERIDKLES